MIAGVGLDLVEVSRMEKSLKNPRFIARVFGDSEQKLFLGNHRTERAAANFAAKEAFGKALGSGIAGFSLREVEVLRGEKGEPYLALHGRAKELAQLRGLRFFLSLTHTAEYAQAIVIAETDFRGGNGYDYLDGGTDEKRRTACQ